MTAPPEPAAVRILAPVVMDLVAHARTDAPFECCGLLVGLEGTIVQNVRTTNVARSRTRYLVAPAEHFALIRALRGTDRVIAGAYHSHPRGRAVPSARDIAEAFDPELLYVIVGLEGAAGPDLRAYRIRSGSFTELPLVVME